MQLSIKKYAISSIFALNLNGKYTVTPTVTVIIVTACLKNISSRTSFDFLVTRDYDRYFYHYISVTFVVTDKNVMKNNSVTDNVPLHLPLPLLSVTYAYY